MWQISLRFLFLMRYRKQVISFTTSTFHNDWTPTFLAAAKPMVWGPVGHHPLILKQFILPSMVGKHGWPTVPGGL